MLASSSRRSSARFTRAQGVVTSGSRLARSRPRLDSLGRVEVVQRLERGVSCACPRRSRRRGEPRATLEGGRGRRHGRIVRAADLADPGRGGARAGAHGDAPRSARLARAAPCRPAPILSIRRRRARRADLRRPRPAEPRRGRRTPRSRPRRRAGSGDHAPQRSRLFRRFLGVQRAGGVSGAALTRRPAAARSRATCALQPASSDRRPPTHPFPEVLTLARLLRAQGPASAHHDRRRPLRRLLAILFRDLPAGPGDDVAFLQFTSGSTGNPKG